MQFSCLLGQPEIPSAIYLKGIHFLIYQENWGGGHFRLLLQEGESKENVIHPSTHISVQRFLGQWLYAELLANLGFFCWAGMHL